MEYHRGNDPYLSRYNVILMSIAVAVPLLMWLFKLPKGKRAFIATDSWPLLGHALQFQEEKLNAWLSEMLFKANYRTGEPNFEVFTFGRRLLFLSSWDCALEVLAKRPQNFRRDKSFERWAGPVGTLKGLFNVEQSDWGRIRRLTNHSFGQSNMKPMSEAAIRLAVPFLKDLADRQAAASGGIFDASLSCRKYTASVIFDLAFGTAVSELPYIRDGLLFSDIEIMMKWIFRRSTVPLPVWMWKYVSDNVERRASEIIPKWTSLVQTILQRSERHSIVFLDTLKSAVLKEIGSRSALTDEELSAQILTFLIAGTDTTSSAIESFLFMVSQPRYQALQRELQEEIDRVLGASSGGNDDNSANLDGFIVVRHLEQTEQLPLVTATFMETLRLYGPAQQLYFQSTAARDVPLPGGFILSPNDLAVVNIAGLMQDENVFENAIAFNPHRWLPTHTDEVRLKRMHECFMSFGAGPRICPGQKLAMLEGICATAGVLRNFDISLGCDPAEVKLLFSFTTKMSKLPLTLTRR